MSTPMYTNMPPPPRRVPFNHHAINHPALNPAINVVNPRHIMSDTPPKPQDPVKPPSSPPLPRQNAKVTPPSPPKIITDKSHSVEFVRVGMLGEVCRDDFVCAWKELTWRCVPC